MYNQLIKEWGKPFDLGTKTFLLVYNYLKAVADDIKHEVYMSGIDVNGVKTMGEKKKMLVTSIFFFSHNVFIFSFLSWGSFKYGAVE